MRFIMPIILIGISITVFFMFAQPIYNNIAQLNLQVKSYDEALDNARTYRDEEDKLTKKYNSIDQDNLIKIQKLLPDNISNIRLILEIEQIALPYGMALKDVKYNATDTTKTTSGDKVATVQGGEAPKSLSKDYGVWDLSFSTTGSYNNFLSFTRDLEKNLRVVDISSIEFSSDAVSGTGSNSTPNSASAESYRYDFKIKTYWLKN
jgi:Tfp pilus assembly protein PilO